MSEIKSLLEKKDQSLVKVTQVGIPEAQLKHRLEFMQFVLSEATPWHRKHLTRMYEKWETWNLVFFGGELKPPYILLAEPSAPTIFGDCSKVSCFGSRLQIRIRPSLIRGTHRVTEHCTPEGRSRFADDVLLHETIHQYQCEITGETEAGYHGHGPTFRDMCNTIGTSLGLSNVRTCKKRGENQSLPSCSQWPHNVRPLDYYGGVPEPVAKNTLFKRFQKKSLDEQWDFLVQVANECEIFSEIIALFSADAFQSAPRPAGGLPAAEAEKTFS